MKARGRWIVSALVSLTVLGLLFRHVKLGTVLPILGRVEKGALFSALSISLLFPFLAAWRWRASLRFGGLGMTYSRALRLTLAVWPLASLTPAKAGDFARVLAFHEKGEIRRAVLAMVAERGIDLWVLALFASAGAWTLWPSHRWVPVLFWTLSISGAMVGCGTLRRKMKDLPVTFLEVGSASALVWSLSILQWLLVLSAVGCPAYVWEAVTRLPAALLAGALPLTWAGLGVREGAFMALYHGLLDKEAVLAASIIFTACRYLIPGVLGLPWTFRVLSRRR